jgi:hypothetical protein
MKVQRVFSPVKILLDQPEEVKELSYVLEEFLHTKNRLPWGKNKEYHFSLMLLENLRKVPLATDLD